MDLVLSGAAGMGAGEKEISDTHDHGCAYWSRFGIAFEIHVRRITDSEPRASITLNGREGRVDVSPTFSTEGFVLMAPPSLPCPLVGIRENVKGVHDLAGVRLQVGSPSKIQAHSRGV